MKIEYTQQNKELTELTQTNKSVVKNLNHHIKEHEEWSLALGELKRTHQVQEQGDHAYLEELTKELNHNKNTLNALDLENKTLENKLKDVRAENSKLISFCASLSETKSDTFLKTVQHIESTLVTFEQLQDMSLKSINRMSGLLLRITKTPF